MGVHHDHRTRALETELTKVVGHGEAGGRLVYAHGAAQVYVANGGIPDGIFAGDEQQGEDSDSH